MSWRTELGEDLLGALKRIAPRLERGLARRGERAIPEALSVRAGEPLLPSSGFAARTTPLARTPERRVLATNVTSENVPYAFGRHRANDITRGSDEVRREYSLDPRASWLSDEGTDVLLDAYGMQQLPAELATGFYTPPGGVLENNPVVVSQPVLSDLAHYLSPEDEAALNVVQGVRGYTDVQGGGAWHRLMPGLPDEEMGSLFLPREGETPARDLLAIQRASRRHGLGDVVDTPYGVSVTSFYPEPPSGSETADALLNSTLGARLAIASGVSPKRVGMQSGYFSLEDALKAPTGQGYATRELQDLLYANPRQAEVLMEDPGLMYIAQRKADMDRGLGREDVLRSRELIGEGGLKKLLDALAKGVPVMAEGGAVEADQLAERYGL